MRDSAVKHPNVEYVDGTSEKIPVADGAADLVTVAQACHWFNLPVFFKEVNRVLKPGQLNCEMMFDELNKHRWHTGDMVIRHGSS